METGKAETGGTAGIVVIHSIPVWLAQTQAWLYTSISPIPGGVQSHVVCERVENLEQFGLPNVHSLTGEPLWRRKFHNLIRRPTRLRYADLIARKAGEHGARLLHSHFGNLAWRNMAAAGRAGLRHVVTFHGVDIYYIPRNMPEWKGRYAELFQRVDMVLCEGHNMMKCLADVGCPEEKIRLQRLGVDLEDIPFRPRAWRPGTPLRVLVAGSFREKKGIPYALEALGRLKGKLDLEITLIGEANEEQRNLQEKRRILAVMEEHGLAPITRVLGYQPQSGLFREAYGHHVFLSPSVTAGDGDIEGGMPITIIELLASGMPVVSTTHCDIPEVVRDGVSGLLAAERDVEGLVRHIRWLAAHPGEWAGMALAGRRRVEEEFDARLQGGRLMRIYEEVLGV
jgi:colanic acid/amylovoran biosynthesis glycosyltransferase